MHYPAYRLLRGKVCQQASKGDRWIELSTEEADYLLAQLSELRFEASQGDPNMNSKIEIVKSNSMTNKTNGRP